MCQPELYLAIDVVFILCTPKVCLVNRTRDRSTLEGMILVFTATSIRVPSPRLVFWSCSLSSASILHARCKWLLLGFYKCWKRKHNFCSVFSSPREPEIWAKAFGQACFVAGLQSWIKRWKTTYNQLQDFITWHFRCLRANAINGTFTSILCERPDRRTWWQIRIYGES